MLTGGLLLHAGCYGIHQAFTSPLTGCGKSTTPPSIGASGELSDFQAILTMLDELSTEDCCSDDGTHLTSKEIYTYLTEVLYNRKEQVCPSSVVTGRHF